MAKNTQHESPSATPIEMPAAATPIDHALALIHKMREDLKELEKLAKEIKSAAPKPDHAPPGKAKKAKDGKKKKKHKD